MRVSPEDDVDDKSSEQDDASADEEDDEPPEIVNGKGYWVWSKEPGTLVP